MLKGMKRECSIARSNVYETLSLCFSYPWGQVLPWFLERAWIKETERSIRLLSREISIEPLRHMDDYLFKAETEVGLELTREYTRLFINAFPRVPAPPYGSVYLEESRLVHGRTTMDVLNFYRSTGFEPNFEQKELPDHISLEMEFLGILAARESRTGHRGANWPGHLRQEFLSRFVLPWVPSFCEHIISDTDSPFYRALGCLTAEFLAYEHSCLNSIELPNVRKKNEQALQGDDKWLNDTA
jgi:TorA maturation chaperone TorD